MACHRQPQIDPNTALPEPLPLELLDDPLKFLMLQQVRQRALYAMMRQVAAKGFVSIEKAKSIVTLLAHDLVLHRSDEEYDLFPALKRRATAEDNVAELIDELQESGVRLERVRSQLTQALGAPDDDGIVYLNPRAASLMVSYAVGQQRRLAAEHGILMVLARRRLTAKDLEVMSASMKKQRSITP